MKFFLKFSLLLSTLFLISTEARAGRYVLSFDDAPLGDSYFSGTERTRKLVKGLKEAGVDQAVFYCNPGRADDESVRLRLSPYAQAGHIIANHTLKHPRLDKVSADDFIHSIAAAEEKLRDYPTFRKWFRYPFLHEGENDTAKHLEVKKFLKDHGYRLGYVTVDVYDWHIDARIQKALKSGKKIDWERLKSLYLKVVGESVRFYEDLAQSVLGGSPIHVILLHENDLNALFIEDLVKKLHGMGFDPVKAEDAFTDPIASPEWDVYPLSMQRLRLIAKKKGYPGPTGPKWVSTKNLDQLIGRSGVILHRRDDSLPHRSEPPRARTD